MIRVAIFNDSSVLRARLRMCLSSEPGFEVVLEADNARHARQQVIECRADLVLMDVIMPDVDGYEATRDIIDAHPLPIVIVTAALNPRDSGVIFSALAAGALYVTGPPYPGDPRQNAAFLQLLRAMAGASPRRSRSGSKRLDTASAVLVPEKASLLTVIAVASSAGGPQVLIEILRGLPSGVLPPILVVQHLAASFDQSFASWLARSTGHPTVLADHGTRAERGTVYLAPEARHLTWRRGELALDDTEPVAHFRPSANVLFRSLCSEGARALAVVLSGMGNDGAEGAEALHRAGGQVLVQNRASAAVWGMPGEVVRRGVADEQLPAAGIAKAILTRAGLS